jgi:hypothetical protein
MLRSRRIPILVCAVLALVGGLAVTRQARAELDPVPLLQQALRFRVTIHVNPRTGFMLPAYHCRRAKEGCDQRLMEFARYLSEAGEQYEVDPWLLAAMAYRESSLNPFAVGGYGEAGILQLHPRSRTSKGVRFVRDTRYRTSCQRESGACQREVVERAAQMLRSSFEKCGGDMVKALGMYNTGKCGGNPPYAKRVLKERKLLLKAVGLELEGLPGSTQDPLHAATARKERTPARD